MIAIGMTKDIEAMISLGNGATMSLEKEKKQKLNTLLYQE